MPPLPVLHELAPLARALRFYVYEPPARLGWSALNLTNPNPDPNPNPNLNPNPNPNQVQGLQEGFEEAMRRREERMKEENLDDLKPSP